MKNYVIVAESGSDLPQSTIHKYKIKIVPMHVEMGGIIRDDGSFPVEKLFESYEKTGILPKTSGCSPIDFELVFDEIHLSFPDKHILHFAYSSVTTVSFQSAQIAAINRDYVTSFDTKNVSAGQAVIIQKVAQFIEENPDVQLQEIEEKVQSLIASTHMCFLPESLLYLKAGGRVSNPAYLGSRLLNLKALIEIQDGQLISTRKYRGSMEKIICKLLDSYTALHHLQKDELTLINGVLLSQEIKKAAENHVKNLGFKQIQWIQTGCVVSAHGGPSTFGIVGQSGKDH